MAAGTAALMSRRDRYWEQRRFSDRLLDPIAWWLLNPLFRSLERGLLPEWTDEPLVDFGDADDEAVA